MLFLSVTHIIFAYFTVMWGKWWRFPGMHWGQRQGGMLIFGTATLVNCIVSLEGKRKKKKKNPNDHKWED